MEDLYMDAAKVKKITRVEWTNILTDIATKWKNGSTLYGWGSPVNMENSSKKATCVSYVGCALQEAGYLPKNKYINFQDTCKMHGPGAAYVREHKELFTVYESVNKSPQDAGLQIGDIVGYKAHIMVFAGWQTVKGKKYPLWWSLERNGSKGVGKKPMFDIKQRFEYYDTRKIDGGIVRLKFATATTASAAKPVTPAPAPTRYKTKIAMNMRAAANADSKILMRIPKGAIVTVIRSVTGSTWKLIEYCKEQGYMNCASQYATKL